MLEVTIPSERIRAIDLNVILYKVFTWRAFKSKNVDPACLSNPAKTFAGYLKSTFLSSQILTLITSIDCRFSILENSFLLLSTWDPETNFCIPKSNKLFNSDSGFCTMMWLREKTSWAEVFWSRITSRSSKIPLKPRKASIPFFKVEDEKHNL